MPEHAGNTEIMSTVLPRHQYSSVIHVCTTACQNTFSKSIHKLTVGKFLALIDNSIAVIVNRLQQNITVCTVNSSKDIEVCPRS